MEQEPKVLKDYCPNYEESSNDEGASYPELAGLASGRLAIANQLLVFEQIRNKTNVTEVWAGSRFEEDLGFDSLDMTELCIEVGADIGVDLMTVDYSRMKTVGDFFNVLEDELENTVQQNKEPKKYPCLVLDLGSTQQLDLHTPLTHIVGNVYGPVYSDREYESIVDALPGRELKLVRIEAPTVLLKRIKEGGL